jgi:hypothetical protein
MIGTSDLKMKACQQISSEKQNKNQQKCWRQIIDPLPDEIFPCSENFAPTQ